MVKVYCEVIDDEKGFQWRIIAEAGALGRFEGAWQNHYPSFAILKAPTGEGGRMQVWIAGSSYWSKTGLTLGEFPEFTPFSVGEDIGSSPIDVKRDVAVEAAKNLSGAALVEAARNGAELETCDEE